MTISYKRLTEKEIDIFITMRVAQRNLAKMSRRRNLRLVESGETVMLMSKVYTRAELKR